MNIDSEKLYPEGSLLMLSIYPAAHENDEHVFRELYRVVREHVESSAKYVDVIPREHDYDLVYEHSDLMARMEFDGSRDHELPFREDTEYRVVKAYVGTERLGPVIITYEPADGAERHPVTAYLADDVLGIPDELWSEEDRRAAAELHDWAHAVFSAACTRTVPRYAQLASETSLPLPHEILAGQRLDGTVYLSKELIDENLSFTDSLRVEYGAKAVEELSHGFIFDDWLPFRETGITRENYRGYAEKIREVAATGLSDR
ncbi:hypothetical protein [Amycolatopsis samaneae]|uniref:Uncharacterized protein n=1 Tax=Amycolatopsis samaneae TaxID=664691 RepID=A0ABW5G8J3_9PSEU